MSASLPACPQSIVDGPVLSFDMANPKWTAPTWREWFFEVFAPNSYIRPLRPLPMTEAERQERTERDQGDTADNITRLNLDNDASRE